MKSTFTTILLISAILAITGCNNSASTSESPADAIPDDGVRLVSITANDTLQFNVTEIKAKSGEKLRIRLTNIGKMPKQSMAHNWVLLKPMDTPAINAFGIQASAAGPEYLPKDKSQIIAHTKMLGPGESDLIELTAPAASGQYPFICSFPGHYAVMKGILIVE